MGPLTLEVRKHSDGAIECWDDDDELQCYEDIHLRTASSATSVTNSSVRRSGHRDSISSRRSARSDLDSTAGGDEDWQIQLLSDDELVNEEAIASVKNAGIPLPTDVPRTALVGGTIKRLGKRKTKREFIDDWSDDLELPEPHAALELRRLHDTSLPEALFQIGTMSANLTGASPQSSTDGVTQDHLSDDFPDDMNQIGAQDVAAIGAAKQRPQMLDIHTDLAPSKVIGPVDTFEDDFELPSDNLLHLHLPSGRASSPTPDDADVDWSEGSIGVRFGGTAREHRSNPSSSISVVSPSASSYVTGESDDEGLDGLVIPEGPLKLDTRLGQPRRSITTVASDRVSDNDYQTQSRIDDFFTDLEINSGDVFNPNRASINPNIKCKAEPPGSPARRSATTLTFTNAAISPKTRIPRLSGHDRTHSTHLETVSESGAPLSKFRAFPRRPGHVSHSSVSSLPMPGPVALSPLSFTSTRSLTGTRNQKEAPVDGRTTGKQSLKMKRSMPSMRNAKPSDPSTSLPIPPRQGGLSWLSSRRSAAIDRTGLEAKLSARKPQVPFLPAGSSDKQSHHASVKSYRSSRRTDFDGINETSSSPGTVLRLSRSRRHEGSANKSNGTTSETLSTTPKRTITRPARRRNYGDGTELAAFDDLPTSTVTENKFVKQPSGRGAPRSLKSKLSTSQPAHSKPDSFMQIEPMTSTPPMQQATVPRFARDTNASRNAREQRIASMSSIPRLRENNPLTPLSSNWRATNLSRVPSTTGSIRGKKGKIGLTSGSKPQLIKPIGAGVQEKRSINGMHYNPVSFRWEGNENLVHGFDNTIPKSPKSSPALITNVGALQNVQIVGGMVFDPQRMCWLKLAASQPGGDGVVAVEDEDDVFSNLTDLTEAGASGKRGPGVPDDIGFAVSGDDRSGEDSSEEWPMTEEFDVGPEFIRRQHTEEEKWRRKVDKWMDYHPAGFGSNWRWAIRDLVKSNSTLGAQEFSTS